MFQKAYDRKDDSFEVGNRNAENFDAQHANVIQVRCNMGSLLCQSRLCQNWRTLNHVNEDSDGAELGSRVAWRFDCPHTGCSKTRMKASNLLCQSRVCQNQRKLNQVKEGDTDGAELGNRIARSCGCPHTGGSEARENISNLLCQSRVCQNLRRFSRANKGDNNTSDLRSWLDWGCPLKEQFGSVPSNVRPLTGERARNLICNGSDRMGGTLDVQTSHMPTTMSAFCIRPAGRYATPAVARASTNLREQGTQIFVCPSGLP